MGEWQPIETAPKDGTEIVAWRDDSGWFAAFFGSCENLCLSDGEIEAAINEVGEDSFFLETWWAFTQDGVQRLEGSERPTHWMPLPTPPENT